jgi:integrase
MPLTVAQLRGLEPRDKPYKVADAGGLFAYVPPSGRISFRMKFRFGGQEQLLTLGTFPETSLAAAREQRGEARRLIGRGQNPAELRRQTRAAAELELVRGTAFEDVARAWYAAQAPQWSPRHATDVLASLERDVFPSIGALPIGAIDTPKVREAIRAIEARGAGETARRVLQRFSCIFAHAIAEGLVTADPSAPIGKVLRQPGRRKRRQKALLELKPLRALLAAADGAAGGRLVKLASRLLALTIVRPGVIRGAAWSEFEGIDWSTGAAENPVWRVPAARMKLTREKKNDSEFEHLVLLSAQAVTVLLEIRAIAGAGELLFPNRRDRRRGLSKGAIAALYERAGFAGRQVPHGWRAAFSTIMNGLHRADRAVIDLVLAHTPKEKVEAAYNRAEHLDRRAELLQEWADLLA